MKLKKILVLGDVFVDMTTEIDRFPENIGDSTFGTPISISPGGTAGNVAAGLGRLKADVSIISSLGDDENGRYLLNSLKESGADTLGVQIHKEYTTGSVMIMRNPEGERSIFVLTIGSSHEKLSSECLDYIEECQPDYIYITGVLLGVFPSQDTIKKVLEKWKSKARIYFDPNLRYPINAVPQEIVDVMQEICKLSDVALIGESERKALFLEPVSNQIFIEKLGKEGSRLVGEKGETIYKAPATKHIAKDATGAGDNYAAGYIYAESLGLCVKDSMDFATVASGLSVTKEGARSMPSINEINTSLENYIKERGQ